MTTPIAIIEDDDSTRQLLAKIIAATPRLSLVASYSRCAPALAELPALAPAVVLTDINLPEMTGVEAVRLLKPQLPATQFLMLTAYDDSEHIFAALAAGATGYLLKTTTRDELLAGIDLILTGGSPMSTGIARKVVSSFAASSASESTSGAAKALARLSPREQTVLSLLSQGYIYKEIAHQLGVGLPTVSTYIRRIYEKLQVNSRTQAVRAFLQK